MRSLRFFLFFLMLQTLCFCSESCSSEDSVSLVTWNVQTFFDGVKDGCEYSEFLKSSSWNTEKYLCRLERLRDVIVKLNADVYVFEEIENERILQDLSNQLAGFSWRGKGNWKYSCFAKPDGTGIGIGILSKYELSGLTTHNLDIRTQKGKVPDMRYLLEVTVKVKGKSFVLFANHWKSMSGGKQETEIWRDWQESVLATRIFQMNNGGFSPVVVCGDFNRDVGGFVQENDNVILRFGNFGKTGTVEMKSPWLLENGDFATETGSYFYRDNWERIDHVFYSGSIKLIDFEPVAQSPWATDGKIPFSYKISSGEGYSDHLPLKCEFTF